LECLDYIRQIAIAQKLAQNKNLQLFHNLKNSRQGNEEISRRCTIHSHQEPAAWRNALRIFFRNCRMGEKSERNSENLKEPKA
jgi:hypothetical protein